MNSARGGVVLGGYRDSNCGISEDRSSRGVSVEGAGGVGGIVRGGRAAVVLFSDAVQISDQHVMKVWVASVMRLITA